MFFVTSKILGFFANPSNLLIVIGLIGAALLWTRFARAGRWMVVGALIMIAVFGLSPVGNALMVSLEQRFPPWDSSRGAPDGIVILGGAISPDISSAHDDVALNEAAERMTKIAELARRYPNARIVFSGGSPALFVSEEPEAVYAARLLRDFGIDPERIQIEEQSRNTVENAVFSRLIAQPKPGERWLLVTSAYHMPRSVGAFRQAGFAIEPFPVDWRTRGAADLLRPFGTLGDGLRRTDTAVREWVGLAAYWLSGRSSALFPKPD